MAGYIPALPTETSGAPELNRWEGVRTEPSLSERIDGHVPYPGPPPAYDVENYARYAQWRINSAVAGVALQLEHKLAGIALTGVTVGNQRRITINGTNIDYSDASGNTLADVTQAFVDLINENAILTAGASAVQADYVTAGMLAVYSIAAGTAPTFAVSVSVLSGTGAIAAATDTTPDVVIPATVLAGVSRNIVLGLSANAAGADNNTRFVLDRAARAVRVGTVTGTEWDTRQPDSVGLGTMAQPDGADSVAVGTSATAADRYDVAIGAGASADGQTASGALALGRLASATGSASTAVGIGAAASGTQADAFGRNANASGDGSLALGLGSVASGDRSVCVGNSDATGDDAVAVGTGCIASVQGAIAIGNNTEASDVGALATGRNGTGVLDPTVKATGRGARAHGAPSSGTLVGTPNVLASGVESEAMGEGCQASGDYSRATGYGALATNRGEQAHASLGIAPGLDGFLKQCVHQAGRIIAQARTNGAQTLRCKTDATNSNTGLTWTPRDDRGYWVDVRVVAKDGASSAIKVWSGRGYVTVDAGTAAAAVTLTTDGGLLGVSTPTVAASGAGIYVEVASALAGVVYWTCEIQYVQAGADY